MPHVEVAGRNLHYVREGEGEPLLLIQGLSGNHMHWGDDFLGLLHPHFDVIAYDHRGIGHSDPAGGPFTIADLADDAAGLLDALGIESRPRARHLDGRDDGAGARAAPSARGAHARARVHLRRRGRLRDDRSGRRPAAGRAVHDGSIEEALRYGFEVNVSPAFAQDPARFEMVKEIAGQLPSTLDLLMLQVQAVAGHDTSDRLGEIEAPTLVIHGTVDQMLPVSNATRSPPASPARGSRSSRTWATRSGGSGRRSRRGSCASVGGGRGRLSRELTPAGGGTPARPGGRRRARPAHRRRRDAGLRGPRPRTAAPRAARRAHARGHPGRARRTRPHGGVGLGIGFEADPRRQAFGAEVPRHALDQLQRLLGLSAGMQDPRQGEPRVRPVRLELERLAQRGLVARLDERVGLAGHQFVEEALHGGGRLRAHELARRPRRP